MKKTIVITLTLCLLLAGCGGNSTAPAEEAAPAQQTVIPAVTEGESVRETDAAACADDMFAVECIAYRVVNGKFNNFEIKIRNITDQKLSTVIFTVQGLDQNGDVTESWFMGNNGAVDAGQAFPYYCRSNFTDTCASVEEVTAQMEYIKIVGVRVVTAFSDNTTMEEYDFKDAPVFKISDIQPKQ